MSKLMDLLLEWEDRLALGDIVSPEELCKNHAGVDVSTLRNHIDKLQKLNRVLEIDPDDLAENEQQSSIHAEVPTELDGYVLHPSLGAGGMGVVVLAHEIELNRQVAIKFLPRMANANRFQREAQVLALLKHPHIVPIYHSQLRNGTPHFVMEYVSGGNLADRVKDIAQGPVEYVIQLMIKVTKAVQFAHEQGVIHRDLKPANILIDDKGEPRVTDFGLAKFSGSEEEPILKVGEDTFPDSIALTKTGAHIGTPSYMAPEQYGSGEITQQVDIWALGVILYELLTGARPFSGNRFEKLQPQVLLLEPPSMQSIRRDIPSALESIVQKCMKKSPGDRYLSAAALVIDLERFPLEQKQISRRSKFIRSATVAIAATILIGTLSAILFRNDSQPAETKQPSNQEVAKPPDSGNGKQSTLIERFPSEEEYRRAVKPLQQLLSNGEKVDLVKPFEKPVGYRLRESTDVKLHQSESEGSLAVFHDVICFLELIPSLDIERYRITAKIRHEQLTHSDGFVGIYQCYRQVVNKDGTLHCCSMQLLSDPMSKKQGVSLTKPLFGCFLASYIDCDGKKRFFAESHPLHFANRTSRPPDWHTIQLDVDRNKMSVKFDGVSRGASDLTSRITKFQEQGPVKDAELKLEPRDFQYPSNGAVGIFIRSGGVRVQHFSIEPLP